MNSKKKNFLVPKEEPYFCEHCGEKVMGGRYNNHCPFCLWSKHVDDKLPGDRASKCRGMMEPIGVVQKRDKWRIVQECISCGKHFTVDSSPKDNINIIIQLPQE
jgi:hypothetical protein